MGQYLIHHGVEGMKWGVRHGPPYPLEGANRKKFLKDRDKNTNGKYRSGMSMFAGINFNDWGNPTDDGWREMVPWEGHYKANGEQVFACPEHSEIRETRYRPDFTSKDESWYKKINPTFEKEEGTTANCTKCAAAGVMAFKGYDYQAGRSRTGNCDSPSYWFHDAQKTPQTSPRDYINHIKESAPDGNYGVLSIRKQQNVSGHSLCWRKEKGNVVIYDGQDGRKYNSVSDFCETYPYFDDTIPSAQYDLTNSEPNWDHLAEDSVLTIRNDGTPNSENNLMYNVRNGRRTLFF